MKISINSKEHEIANTAIDYLSATGLAFPGTPDVLFTVTWKRPDGASGTLGHGQKVMVVEGLIINVAYTGRA